MNRLNAAQSKGRRVDLVEAATANSPIVVANSLDDDSADDDSLNLPIPVEFRRSQQSQKGQKTGKEKRESVDVKDLDVDAFTLASPYLLFDSPRSSTKKIESNRASFLAGGAFGISQRIVISVLLALVCIGAVGAIAVGVETAQEWWDHTNYIQRAAPLYMLSLLPYLDFLWKLQQSKPQATTAMVFSFACVLVFVVVSTPVEVYSRVKLGRDVADVDILHFLVQGLIAATNLLIILAFKNEIKRKKAEMALRDGSKMAKKEIRTKSSR